MAAGTRPTAPPIPLNERDATNHPEATSGWEISFFSPSYRLLNCAAAAPPNADDAGRKRAEKHDFKWWYKRCLVPRRAHFSSSRDHVPRALPVRLFQPAAETRVDAGARRAAARSPPGSSLRLGRARRRRSRIVVPVLRAQFDPGLCLRLGRRVDLRQSQSYGRARRR